MPHRYKVAQRLQHRIVGFQSLVINLVVDDNAMRFENPDQLLDFNDGRIFGNEKAEVIEADGAALAGFVEDFAHIVSDAAKGPDRIF